MKFGEFDHTNNRWVKAMMTGAAALSSVAFSAQSAWAQAVENAAKASDRFAVAPGSYVPLKPVEGVGMPVPGGIGLQTQYSPLGHIARNLHDGPIMYLIVAISIFVLALLVWVVIRYNARANPVPSKNSHNTVLEVVWTLVPALILFALAFPSLGLLAKQFKPAPPKALTVKVIGNQWFWTYAYPDNGGFEVVSNMLKEKKDPSLKAGERFRTADDGPIQLAADYRMVVPAGEPIRLQVTASDVIHAFAVPSLWFKLDGVPGRINEKVFTVEKPGVYFGQCSELCGVRHGYMPIVVEALPRPEYNRWVLSQTGGVIDGLPKPAEPAAAASAAPAAAATSEAAPAAAATEAAPAAAPAAAK